VKKFMLLHMGFEMPSPEIMEAWNAWFASIADRTFENIGFAGGREISANGTKELGWDMDSLTGCSIIEAESIDEAERIAAECPYIAGIRVYEVREH
jgi:hypothetical protein